MGQAQLDALVHFRVRVFSFWPWERGKDQMSPTSVGRRQPGKPRDAAPVGRGRLSSDVPANVNIILLSSAR